MKWIKKNKFTVIAITIFVVLAIIGYKAKEMFFPNQRTAIYGDRLDGKIAVEQKTYDEMKAKISESDKVKNVSIRENGRRIDIMVTVNGDTRKMTFQLLVINNIIVLALFGAKIETKQRRTSSYEKEINYYYSYSNSIISVYRSICIL